MALRAETEGPGGGLRGEPCALLPGQLGGGVRGPRGRLRVAVDLNGWLRTGAVKGNPTV